MLKILKPDFKIKPRVKTRGSALLVSIVLSALMLTVGIMSARLAVRELELSADLFLSEKAYFSAESGVEKALFLLKTEPLAHVQPSDGSDDLTYPDVTHPTLEDADTEVTINNLINNTTGDFPEDEFSFTLEPLKSQRFRFAYDDDPLLNTNKVALTGSVNIDIDTPGSYFWRILCVDGSGNTLALQKQASDDIGDLTSTTGNLDNGTSENFNNWSGIHKTSCFLTIQNLATAERTFTLSGTTMAPHAAHIHAIGQHQGREKHIRFDYAQSTLGDLFDFSFLHSDTDL